ncbi:ATP-binding protein [Limisalsivibrio acetivorans]|uniref:ATP-binding protein n=1 Tax=Limisalsivibrio acetivorans TaxID=1304888 RepID=UPI0003B79BF2|nr:ATP-binding protein [Limisalsivibrio acetivorans]
MSLRTKTILIFFLTTLSLLAILSLYTRNVLLESYRVNEKKSLEQTAWRILDGIEHRESRLLETAHNIALFTELGVAEDFFKSDKASDTAADILGTGSVIFLSGDGTVNMVRESGRCGDECWKAAAMYLSLDTLPVGGLVRIGDSIYITAGSPVSSGGNIVVVSRLGRSLVKRSAGSYAERTEGPVVEKMESFEVSSAYNRLRINTIPAAIGYFGEDGYRGVRIVLFDIFNKPVARIVYEGENMGFLGKKSVYDRFLLVYVLISLGVLTVFAFIFNRYVFFRIHQHINILQDIGTSRDNTRRLPERGEKEILDLSKSINAMLDNLQNAHHRIISQKEKMVAAEMSSKYKSEFLANMSHEIRTPINGILGVHELLSETELNETQTELTNILDSETRGLLNLVNDILDFSKIEAGKLEVEETSFGLRNLIESLVQSHVRRAMSKGIDFYLYIEPEIPFYLFGDAGKIRQALNNLISNAIKFTSKGSVTVTATLAGSNDDFFSIRFEVKDTGVGIREEAKQSIFESFSQADTSVTRKYGGTGLGLAIYSGLVDLMGGEKFIESEYGKGSTFGFELRLKENKKAPFELDYGTFKDLNVVCVTYDPMIHMIMNRYLKTLGASYYEAFPEGDFFRFDGEKPESIDLLIIETDNTKKDSSDYTERLVQDKRLGDISKVVVCYPGRGFTEEEMEALDIRGTLVKPVNMLKLLSLLFSCVGEGTEGLPFIDEDRKDEESTVPQSGGLHILLVEDYPTNQAVALRHLVRAGHKVDLAENGQEAVELYKQNSYDIILMDVQMPIMDGFTATRKIRHIEEKEGEESGEEIRVPIVAMTAHALEGYREKCIENGMDDYITKPLRKLSLLSMLERWVNRSGEEEHKVAEQPQSNLAKELEAELDEVQEEPESDEVIDYQLALEEFENDSEFLNEVLTDFFHACTEQIEDMKLSLHKGEYTDIGKEAHSIKGGAANLHAGRLKSVAYKLEMAGKEGDKAECARLIPLIEEELTELKSAVAGMQS